MEGKAIGTINVAFNGKPLFKWKGTAEYLDGVEAELKTLAESDNMTVDGAGKAHGHSDCIARLLHPKREP